MKLLHGLLSFTAGLGVCHLSSAQTTIFAQDFNSAPFAGAAPITNSTGTTSSNVSNVNGTLGSGAGSVNYRLGSQQTLSIVDKAGGDYALRLTDNNSVVVDSTIAHNFTGVSTTAIGENIITGSFEYTPLVLGSGNRGDFVFGIATTGQSSPSGATTAVQMTVNGNLGIVYINGGTAVTAAPTLTAGTTYRINVTANFGGATQDTWGFSVVNASTEASLFSISGLNTRAANITPGSIFLATGLNPGRISADPHVQLDNINFVASSAIPEPGSLAAMLGGAALLFVGSRRRRA